MTKREFACMVLGVMIGVGIILFSFVSQYPKCAYSDRAHTLSYDAPKLFK